MDLLASGVNIKKYNQNWGKLLLLASTHIEADKMNTIRILFAMGNAFMTLGSVMLLGKKVHYFGQRVKYHHENQSPRNNSEQKYSKESKSHTKR